MLLVYLYNFNVFYYLLTILLLYYLLIRQNFWHAICLIRQNLLSFIIFQFQEFFRTRSPPWWQCSTTTTTSLLPPLLPCPTTSLHTWEALQSWQECPTITCKITHAKRPWSLKLDKKYFYIMINSRTSYVYIIIWC
jgi:hypothetical protein